MKIKIKVAAIVTATLLGAGAAAMAYFIIRKQRNNTMGR